MNSNYTDIDENGNTKENFCGACVAVPLALVGAGVAGVGAKGGYKKTKNIMLWGGIALTVISVIISIIYLKKCKSCR